MAKKKKIPAFITYILSIFSILIIWQFISKIVNAALILPPPVQVFNALIYICSQKIFWQNFLVTFSRVLVSFILSVVIGGFLGFLCSISPFIKDFLEIPTAIIRATPVVAFILIAYFWFTSNQVPIFVSVLMTLPIMITSVITGFSLADEKLLKMAKVFCFSKREILKYIKIPSCIPSFCSGAISCFGLTWKVVVAGEVLCLPKKAMGTMLQRSQIHLESAEVIAEAFVLVAVSFLIERFFSQMLKKRIKK